MKCLGKDTVLRNTPLELLVTEEQLIGGDELLVVHSLCSLFLSDRNMPLFRKGQNMSTLLGPSSVSDLVSSGEIASFNHDLTLSTELENDSKGAGLEFRAISIYTRIRYNFYRCMFLEISWKKWCAGVYIRFRSY